MIKKIKLQILLFEKKYFAFSTHPGWKWQPEGFLSQSCFCGKAGGSEPLTRNCSGKRKLSG
jgi:hypothetical protein